MLLLLLAAALTMCSSSYPLRSHVSFRHAIHPKRSNAAAISLRFLEMNEMDGDSDDTPTEEDAETAKWAIDMLKGRNGIGKASLKATMKATINKMCTESKAATDILKAIKSQPFTTYSRGEKINAALNVVIFYNLHYNADEVAALAETKGPFMESKIQNKFSAYMVHPQKIGKTEDELAGAFRRAVETLQQLHERAPSAITEIFGDMPMGGPQCYPVRYNMVDKTLADVVAAQEQEEEAGLFDKHTDGSTFVMQWVYEKLNEKFPELREFTSSNVKALFDDDDIQKETGVAGDSPRVGKIIKKLQEGYMVEPDKKTD